MAKDFGRQKTLTNFAVANLRTPYKVPVISNFNLLNMLEIRQATRHDNKSIAKVLGELITSYNEDIEIRNSIIKKLESDSLSSNSMLYYENCHLFEKDNEVAGVVSFYSGDRDKVLYQHLFESPADGIIPQGLYLSMVSVLPKFQGQKIGQALIKSVESSAEKLGYDRVSIKVDATNSRAEKLYRRLGYEYIDEYISDGVTLKYFEKMLETVGYYE